MFSQTPLEKQSVSLFKCDDVDVQRISSLLHNLTLQSSHLFTGCFCSSDRGSLAPLKNLTQS